MEEKKGQKPTFENNQSSLPMQLKKQPFEKLLHPPSSPPSAASSKRTLVIPLSKGFSPLQKGRKLDMGSPLGERKKLNTQSSFSSL